MTRGTPGWLQVVQGLVRPVVTFALVGAFVHGFSAGAALDRLAVLRLPLALVLLFWFGERALVRTGPAVARILAAWRGGPAGGDPVE